MTNSSMGVFSVALAAACALATACAGGGSSAGARKPGTQEPGDRSGDAIAAIAVVRELSGEAYAGRQAGSAGGRMAAEYIADAVRGVGLATSLYEFEEMVPVLLRRPRLAVSAPGEPVRELRFREEYRDVARGAWIGERASGPLAYLRSAADDFPEGAIVMVSGLGYDNAADDSLLRRGAVGLLLILDPPSIERRATSPGQEPLRMAEPRDGLVKMAVSADVAPYLAEAAAKGATVSLTNPLGFERRSCGNLLASWNGDGGAIEPALMFVAHYDHVGAEFDGPAFPGALDNASGVGLALSIAENYARDGIRRDVAFLFTDAEEINLSGASNFPRHVPFRLAGLSVINLDMVGGSGATVLSIYSNGDEKSASLARAMGAALAASGIPTRIEAPVPNVDSGPLARAGAAAITLCEFDEAIYHTYADTEGAVSAEELERLETAVYSFALGL